MALTAGIIFSGCNNFDEALILGTWISTDKADTLEFTDNHNFYKSSQMMRHDHYDYHIDKDSIEIRYNGTHMIYVLPTRHKYYLESNKLTIDFANKQCYGFRREKITFIKE